MNCPTSSVISQIIQVLSSKEALLCYIKPDNRLQAMMLYYLVCSMRIIVCSLSKWRHIAPVVIFAKASPPIMTTSLTKSTMSGAASNARSKVAERTNRHEAPSRLSTNTVNNELISGFHRLTSRQELAGAFTSPALASPQNGSTVAPTGPSD